MPEIAAGDQILVRKGNSKQSFKVLGPFTVVRVQHYQGVPKRVEYIRRNKSEVAALKNVTKFRPRRVDSFGGGE